MSAELQRTVAFKPGDVLAYVPHRHHCLEGTAYVNDKGRAIDTFWQPTGDGESHVLTESELATAELRFNVNDYDALDRYAATSRETWMTYHPEDRGRIPSQHGLLEQLFIRRGAQPDLDTKIKNAQERVAQGESDLRTAEWRLECSRRDLAELEAQR